MAMAAPIPTSNWWVFLLEGIAAILIGLLLLTDPAATVVAITIFLGFYWLFVGVLELVRAFIDRSVPWFWSALIGILGIVAGILVLNHPLFAAVLLPATLVIYLGVLGIVMVLLQSDWPRCQRLMSYCILAARLGGIVRFSVVIAVPPPACLKSMM